MHDEFYKRVVEPFADAVEAQFIRLVCASYGIDMPESLQKRGSVSGHRDELRGEVE